MNMPLTLSLPEQKLTPDEFPEPTKRDIQERNRKLGDICDAIRYSKMELTSMDDNAFELANHLHRILGDDEDDKLGRIRDVHEEYVMRLATWVLDDNGYYSNQLKRKLGL